MTDESMVGDSVPQAPIDHLPVGVVILDGGAITAADDVALGLLGLTEEQITGVMPPPPGWHLIDHHGRVLADAPQELAAANGGSVVGVHHPQEGRVVWLTAHVRGEDGDLARRRMICTLADATALVHSGVPASGEPSAAAEARTCAGPNGPIRDREETLRALVNAPNDAAILIDREGTILALNNTAAQRLVTYAASLDIPIDDGFVGASVYSLFPAELRQQRRARNEEVFVTGRRARFEDERDGFWTDNTIDPVFGADGRVERVAIFSRDITDRKRDEEDLRTSARELEALSCFLTETAEELERSQAALTEKSNELERTLALERELARRDALTGALNHGAITEALFASAAAGEQLAVAMVDVDGMKAANDTYGHQLGDAVLVAVASAIAMEGAIVGRYGGDEFLVILPGANRAAAERFRERVYASLAVTCAVDRETGASFPVAASIGVAVCPETADDAKTVLELADAEMYAEKRARRASGLTRLSSGRRADDRASAVMADLVPILTAVTPLDDKLRLLAHRLAVTCGFDAVNFDLYDDEHTKVTAQNAFAKAPDELVEAWRDEQRNILHHPLGRILDATRQPVLVDLIDGDGPLTPEQVRLLRAAGIRSGVAVPMLWHDAVVGVISVGSKRAGAFGDGDCRLLVDAAAHITAIVRMSQLMDQLEEKSAQLERALEREHDRARRDPLTGLWNHAAITDLIEREIGRGDAARFAIVITDLDRFTAINDTYGHASGDAVLQAVASALTQGDVTVGRYAGDEFLTVLPGADRDEARAYMATVTDAVSQAAVIDPDSATTIPIAMSAGMAIFPDEGGAMDELLRIAEGAMYDVKARRASDSEFAAGRLVARVRGLTDDLVPLLTSPAPLNEKIALVAQRLSSGLGYDAVECALYGPPGEGLLAYCSLVDGEVTPPLEAWTAMQDAYPTATDTDLRLILARTQRPIVIHDLAAEERVARHKRDLIARIGMRSALVVPMMWEQHLIGQMGLASRSVGAFTPEDAQFLGAVARQVTAIVRMATLVDGLQRATERLAGAQDETVLMLAAAAEAHDHTTGVHLDNVRAISEALASELGYSEAAVHALGLAATLHDIGKISVPDSILSVPLRFDVDDWEMARLWDVMKQHSIWGAEFLNGREGFELAAKVARWHHERWDGSGYPDGLSGEQIPEDVAVVTVADAFDAMVSDRPYRPRRPAQAAVDELVACSGRQFCPRIVEALVRLHERGELPGAHEPLERAA